MIGRTFSGAAAAVLLFQASSAHAQVRPYLVAEGGAERRQVLPDGAARSTVEGFSDPSDHKDAFAYGVAAGAEAPLSTALFVGVEAGAARSTVDTEAATFRGIELMDGILIGVTDRTKTHPRWSYAVTGRLGVNLSRSAAVYGLAGFWGERVRVDLDTAIEDLDSAELRTKRSYKGAVFGGGARFLLSDHVGARVEYRRTETDDGYDPQQLMGGLVYRF